MLTRAEQELITAAIDGELSPDEQARFRRLVAESAEAKALYAALKRDRDRLHRLPRVAAPAGLAATVTAAVRPIVVKPEPVRVRRRRVEWAAVAVAASVFLAAVGSGYLFLGRKPSPDRPPAARQTPDVPPRVVIPVEPNRAIVVRPEPTRPVAPPPRAAQSQPAAVATATPPPRTDLGAPPGEPFQRFDLVEVRLPVLLPVADLTRDEAKATVRAELAHDPAFRIDLFTTDTLKAAEAVVAAGKAVRLTVATEAIAGERLKRKMPSAWAVFTDALTPDEMAKWLAAVAAADEKAAAKSPAARVFESVHLIPAQQAEQREVRDLFGIDLAPAKRPRSSVGSPKGVAAGTIDEVTSTLQKDTPKQAVLVTYLSPPARPNPALSKELRAFHDRRGERKPGTVAVLLVIRPAGGQP